MHDKGPSTSLCEEVLRLGLKTACVQTSMEEQSHWWCWKRKKKIAFQLDTWMWLLRDGRSTLVSNGQHMSHSSALSSTFFYVAFWIVKRHKILVARIKNNYHLIIQRRNGTGCTTITDDFGCTCDISWIYVGKRWIIKKKTEPITTSQKCLSQFS